MKKALELQSVLVERARMYEPDMMLDEKLGRKFMLDGIRIEDNFVAVLLSAFDGDTTIIKIPVEVINLNEEQFATVCTDHRMKKLLVKEAATAAYMARTRQSRRLRYLELKKEFEGNG